MHFHNEAHTQVACVDVVCTCDGCMCGCGCTCDGCMCGCGCVHVMVACVDVGVYM